MRARLSLRAPRWQRQHWLALVGLGLAAYFGYHAVNGSRGLFAWRDVNAELAATQQELESLRAERRTLDERVRRLRHNSLDPDLIDELARKELSFVEPLDVIILLDGKDAPK
ncbi:MAG TPA: septum formation initiator family protein [Geminicoccaceae bacterium]|nr:septum formation initiator family protein [Geminicoccaceae bacterium]